jgi:hypothetical protein
MHQGQKIRKRDRRLRESLLEQPTDSRGFQVGIHEQHPLIASQQGQRQCDRMCRASDPSFE